MSHRRRNSFMNNGQGQDPGKDLFAYLFLLMMVFVFVLLMTLHQVQAGTNMTPAPTSTAPQGGTILKDIKQNQVGTLVKQGDQLVLCFGKEIYRPQRDIERLLASTHLVTDFDKSGNTRKIIYLDAGQPQAVLLGEYLTSFKTLSRAGISVAFVEKVAK